MHSRRLLLVLLFLYAAASLVHFIHNAEFLAPISAHTAAMNGTILLEVTAAALVLAEAVRQLVLQCNRSFT